ncbi:uncharacterized protein SCHCODRAFT_02035868 [Schizophyllum commune H4-8]|nr:uncharacterized protein SCHCODRAFT_02035868 [Schizophyllum commune H4-8]KAI5900394.1 hypothetical protein SCHCODRAFT_02035868 [Schizophyllum commune H4-8]
MPGATIITHDVCLETNLQKLEQDSRELRQKLSGLNSSLKTASPGMRATLDLAAQTVERYDDQMNALMALHQTLKNQRAELAHRYARAAWLCSPVRRLVPDVLLEIFTYVRYTQEYSLEDHRSSTVRLAHICSHWRAVAFSHPALWSSIKVQHVGTSDVMTHRVRSAVEFHLSKSDSAPLSIASGGIGFAAIDILIDACHRWRKCIIGNAFILGPTPRRYAALEILVIHAGKGTVNFIDTPRLRSYAGPLTETFLPWHQLTNVSIIHGEVTVSQAIDLLGVCVKVEAFRVHLPLHDTPSSPTTVTCPQLRQLALVCAPTDLENVLKRLFSSIIASGLVSLDIGVPAKLPDYVWTRNLTLAMTGFLKASGALSMLALRNVPIDTDLRTVLASAPSINFLIWWERAKDIHQSRIRHLLDALSLPSSQAGSTLVLPRLTRLHISGGINCPFKSQRKDHERLEELIRARASGGGSLRAVGLDYLGWCELAPETEVELHRLLQRLVVRKMVKRERDFFEYNEPAFVFDMEPPSPGFFAATPSSDSSDDEEESNTDDESGTEEETCSEETSNITTEDSEEDSD